MSATTRREALLATLAAGGTCAFAGLMAQRAFAAAPGKGTLRMAMFKPAGNLDPQKYVGIWGVQAAVFEPLIHYGQGGRLEPALAQSWSVSDDRKVITFKLRANASFSDGTPWNAETMTWGMNRWIGTKRAGWLGVSREFDKLVTVDDMTVALHLKNHVPAALQELVIVRPVRFLSPKAAAPDGEYMSPVGTGPWKVAVNDEARTVLVRNESYWGPKPAIETIELMVIPDARSRIAALRAGDIDLCGGSKIGPLSPQEAAMLLNSGQAKVFRAPGADTMILGVNSERPILQDERVRHAMSLCLDREAIAKKLLNGFATPTMNLFPETIPYSGKRIAVPRRDVAKASALLEEAGWTGSGTRQKDGKPLALELVISEDAVAGSRALGEVIQGQLAGAGFQITLRNVDHLSRHDDIPAKKYDLALFVTNGAPYDPHATLISLFLSTRPPGTDGKIFIDQRLDPLLLAAVEAPDDKKEAAHQAVYDWLQEHHAIVPIYHGSQIWAHSPRVKNFTLPPTEYELPWEGIELAS